MLFFETDEESGSKDIVYFLEKNKSKVGNVDYVFCLDSGCVDYEHFCLTTTLRGNLKFKVKVEVGKEGVHSGMGSGNIPDSFRIGREIIDRFENTKNGEVLPELYVDIPEDKYQQAFNLVKAKGGSIDFKLPFSEGVTPIGKTGFQNYLDRIWRPQLTLIGMDGVPSIDNCGNVLRPSTTFAFSLRLPPTLPIESAKKTVREFFEKEKALQGALVEYNVVNGGQGFSTKQFKEEDLNKLNDCALEIFKTPVLFMGEGGSIPFLNEFQGFFPEAMFLVAGVLGPESNAHSPNEFLHLDYLEKLVLTIARFIEEISK